MAIEKIYANVSCTDLSRSSDWYGTLFLRPPDARPMAGLAEWHHGDRAGFQLYENAASAGKCTMTLIVRGLETDRTRLSDAGIEVPEIETADTTSLLQLRDPDGNLVVLAEPKRT